MIPTETISAALLNIDYSWHKSTSHFPRLLTKQTHHSEAWYHTWVRLCAAHSTESVWRLVSDDARASDIPTGERLVLRTDGASRGNPGPAAAGVVIERIDGTIITQLGRYLGEMPNNQAEYRALILGLGLVGRFQPASVHVYMDSELVVRQMTGVYQVRDAMLRQLYREAMTLVDALPQVTFTHVRRAQNALADRLANTALNNNSSRHEPRQHSG